MITLAISLFAEEGCVHVWGYGILGKGPKIDHLKEPSMLPRPLFGYNEVNDDVRVVKIEAGLGHFGAITSEYEKEMASF